MAATVTAGLVRSDGGDQVRVIVDRRARNVILAANDGDGLAVVGFGAARIRRLILVLQDALRHLED